MSFKRQQFNENFKYFLLIKFDFLKKSTYILLIFYNKAIKGFEFFVVPVIKSKPINQIVPFLTEVIPGQWSSHRVQVDQLDYREIVLLKNILYKNSFQDVFRSEKNITVLSSTKTKTPQNMWKLFTDTFTEIFKIC